MLIDFFEFLMVLLTLDTNMVVSWPAGRKFPVSWHKYWFFTFRKTMIERIRAVDLPWMSPEDPFIWNLDAFWQLIQMAEFVGKVGRDGFIPFIFPFDILRWNTSWFYHTMHSCWLTGGLYVAEHNGAYRSGNEGNWKNVGPLETWRMFLHIVSMPVCSHWIKTSQPRTLWLI